MNTITRIVLASSAVLFFGACGDDGLSEEDAQKGFQATNTVLLQGGAAAQSSAANGATSINFTYNCLEGGTATFVGSIDNEAVGTDGNQATFTYTVAFDNCKSQNITIGGDVTYKFDFAGDRTAAVMEYSYVGGVTFAGDISGDCDLDMYGKVTTSNDGQTANVGYEYRGNMCGNDAGSLNARGNITVNIPQT